MNVTTHIQLNTQFNRFGFTGLFYSDEQPHPSAMIMRYVKFFAFFFFFSKKEIKFVTERRVFTAINQKLVSNLFKLVFVVHSTLFNLVSVQNEKIWLQRFFFLHLNSLKITLWQQQQKKNELLWSGIFVQFVSIYPQWLHTFFPLCYYAE